MQTYLGAQESVDVSLALLKGRTPSFQSPQKTLSLQTGLPGVPFGRSQVIFGSIIDQ